MRCPSLDLGTVVILSAMSREAVGRPLAALGSTRGRNNGASVGSVVNGQTVIEAVASNQLSCTITTGRGLPA